MLIALPDGTRGGRLLQESALSIGACGITTSTLADVLDGLGHYGVLSSRLTRLSGRPGLFVGQAYTVSWVPVRKGMSIIEPLPSTWKQVRPFLVPELSAARAKVYVAGAGPLVTDAALAGGLSATYFQTLGFEGVLLGGAVRDPSALADLEIPIVASNFIPTDTQGSYRVAETGTRCSIENCVVETGDWIVSDDGGTVVIPDALVDDVVRRARAIERTEETISARIRAGERLPDIIDEVGRI
jgi:regulator of RNase E activity RraA